MKFLRAFRNGYRVFIFKQAMSLHTATMDDCGRSFFYMQVVAQQYANGCTTECKELHTGI